MLYRISLFVSVCPICLYHIYSISRLKLSFHKTLQPSQASVLRLACDRAMVPRSGCYPCPTCPKMWVASFTIFPTHHTRKYTGASVFQVKMLKVGSVVGPPAVT